MAKKKQSKRRGRGEGGIEELPDGRWVARHSYIDGSGKRQRPAFYGATKGEAMEKLREFQHKQGTGQIGEAKSMLIRTFLDQWLEGRKDTVAAQTYTPYEAHVRRFLKPKLGSYKLAKLTASHIQKLYADLAADGVSSSMRNKVGSTLGNALAHAVRLRLISFNPALAVKKPRVVKREIQYLNVEQSRRFLAHAREDRLYALYAVWITSGARGGELFALTWRDVDFAARSIKITKSLEEDKGKLAVKDTKTGRSRRTVHLRALGMDALFAHKEAMIKEGNYGEDKPVFCNVRGGYLRKSNFQRKSFQPIIASVNAKAIELAGDSQVPALLPKITPYGLRHTAATLLLLLGVNPKIVSEQLGHASVTLTLDTYSHVMPGMQEEASNKLQSLLE